MRPETGVRFAVPSTPRGWTLKNRVITVDKAKADADLIF
jgi:hypothetical protein